MHKLNKYVQKLKIDNSKSDIYIQKIKYYSSQQIGGATQQENLLKFDLDSLETYNKTINELVKEKKNVDNELKDLSNQITKIKIFISDVQKKELAIRKDYTNVIKLLKPLQKRVDELSKQEVILKEKYQKNQSHDKDIQDLFIEKGENVLVQEDKLEKIKEDLVENQKGKKDLITRIEKQMKSRKVLVS